MSVIYNLSIFTSPSIIGISIGAKPSIEGFFYTAPIQLIKGEITLFQYLRDYGLPATMFMLSMVIFVLCIFLFMKKRDEEGNGKKQEKIDFI